MRTVRHNKLGTYYTVVDVLGETITLKSDNGQLKRIARNLFDTSYSVVGEIDDFPESVVPTKTTEVNDAINLVREISTEIQEQAKPKPAPDKSKKTIRLDFSLLTTNKKEAPSVPVKKEQKEPKGKTTHVGGVIKLKDICTELNMDSGKARKILRKALGGDGKWEWSDPQMIKKVKDLLLKV